MSLTPADKAALDQAEAFLAATAEIGDAMPLRYPYALPPGFPDLPRLEFGTLRTLMRMVRDAEEAGDVPDPG